jgi:hypothetical protein
VTWNVLQDASGNLQLLPVEDDVPAGWEIVAVTVNPYYLQTATQRVITKYALRLRFTFAEKQGIDTSTDAGVIVFRNDFAAAEEIDLDSQGIIDGLTYLESVNLLAAGRAAEIRA